MRILMVQGISFALSVPHPSISSKINTCGVVSCLHLIILDPTLTFRGVEVRLRAENQKHIEFLPDATNAASNVLVYNPRLWQRLTS